jgi:hypothetical protein
MHVLGQEHAATCFGGGGKDDCIPDRQTMLDTKLDCASQHGFGRGSHRAAVLPEPYRALSLGRTSPRLAHQYVEQFTQYLGRYENG